MIVLLDTVFHPFELGLAAAAVLLLGLVFLSERPAGLVWVSVAAMATLLTHLVLEHGRWQLIPLYAFVFALSIWLAVPTARRYRAGGAVLRVILAVFVLLPALALLFVAPIPAMPEPAGPFPVGAAILPASGDRAAVTVHYPCDADEAASLVAPYWSRGEVESYELPGVPWFFSTHLSMVPTASLLRAPVAPGQFPVVVAVRSPQSVPSDFVLLTEQVASLGWVVVEAASTISAEEVIALLDELRDGSLDAALEGAADPDRVVILGLGWDPDLGMGLPLVVVGGDAVVSVTSGDSSYGIIMPDARIPEAAFTNRYLLAWPPRLLVGSSDAPPAQLSELMRGTLAAILSPDQANGGILANRPVRDELAETQRAFADLLTDFIVQPFPPSP